MAEMSQAQRQAQAEREAEREAAAARLAAARRELEGTLVAVVGHGVRVG